MYDQKQEIFGGLKFSNTNYNINHEKWQKFHSFKIIICLPNMTQHSFQNKPDYQCESQMSNIKNLCPVENDILQRFDTDSSNNQIPFYSFITCIYDKWMEPFERSREIPDSGNKLLQTQEDK